MFEMHFHFLLKILMRVDWNRMSQQIHKRTSTNSIGKKTRWDDYVEDQLNVASKNLTKYPFDDEDSKKYLEDICSIKSCSDKNAILNFFLSTPYWEPAKNYLPDFFR